jgi:hypothetical protein
MGFSFADTEQAVQAVHDTLIALSYDELSGIPEIRKILAAHGLNLNIQIEASIESATLAVEKELAGVGLSASSSNVEDGLQEWRNMGIRMDDLREAAQMEVRRSEEAENEVFNRIRTVATSLSSRGRNYCWGWLNLHYPDIGLEQNPATVQDERFALLSVPAYWHRIVEAALISIGSRKDKREALSRFLMTLNFAKANT